MARIVFDLDGTLIDSAPDIRQIANGLLAEAGRPPLSLAETRAFIGNGVPVFVQRMRALRDIPDSEQTSLVTRFEARYDAAVDLTRPYPGVAEALASLAEAGHRLGVCTNKPISPTRAVLDHLGLARFFGAVIGGDSLDRRKPDPAPLARAFADLGSGPMIYVGDSETDAECARRAGTPFLLFTRGYRKSPADELPHDAAFDDHSALPRLIAAFCERA